MAEGLVTNDDWKPVGDAAGNYDLPSVTDAAPDDTLIASTSEFIGLLGFFDPAKSSGSGSNDLTKGASASFSSDGKEYGTSYPGKEDNPFKPSNGGTTKAWEEKEGVSPAEIVGTQPRYTYLNSAGLGDKDIWSGRFIRFDFERAGGDPVAPLPEFRYVTDSAEKFYYAPQANAQYEAGSVTIAGHPMPSFTEPPAELARTGLSGSIGRVQSTPVIIAGISVPHNATATVPIDDTTTTPTLGGNIPGSTPPSADDDIGTYYTLSDNYVYSNRYHIESVSSNSTKWTATTATDTAIYPCKYNYVQKHLFEAGGSSDADGSNMTSANDDIDHIQTTVDALQLVKAFRDPIITGAYGTDGAGAGGISDGDIDTYISSQPEGDLKSCAASLKTYREDSDLATRTGPNNGGLGLGDNIDYASTTWNLLDAELTIFGTKCGQRIVEIDNRIGRPTYAGGSGSAAGTPPTIYVNTIPASNTADPPGFLPYGRSLYNNVNLLLGQDVDLLGGIIKDIESLTDLLDLVKNARNKYEIFSGRDKEYS